MTPEEKQLILDKYKEVNIFSRIQIWDIVKRYYTYYIVIAIGHDVIKVKNIQGVHEYISKKETESAFTIIPIKNCPKDIYKKLTSTESIVDKFIPGVLLEYQRNQYGLNGLCIYLGDSTLGHIKFDKKDRQYTCFDEMKIGQFMKGNRYHNMTDIITTYQIVEPNESESHQSLISCYNLFSQKYEFRYDDFIKLKSKLFYHSEDIKHNTDCIVLDPNESDFKIGFFNKKLKNIEIKTLYEPRFFCQI